MSLFIAQTAEDGVFVETNAGNLAAGIDSSQTSFAVGSDIFDAGDIVIIDSERILIDTDAGAGSYTGNTRGYESTVAAAHGINSSVKLKSGTTVLTHTFNGSEVLSLVRCCALERDAVFALEIDGTLMYQSGRNPYDELEQRFEFRPQVPAAGTILKVICWTYEDVNVFAGIS